MNYLKLLVDSYEASCLMGCPPKSRIEFIAGRIFDFTTYDSEMDALLGKKAMEVFRAISEHETIKYIADKDQYSWYIIMCNMPFFAQRINWGTSIRGSWWDETQPPIESCWLFMNGKRIASLTFNEDEWKAFAAAVIEFANG